MAEHLLFLTGKLAEKQLRRILEQMQPTEFTYSVHQLGLSVAGLMTAEMIGRRLTNTCKADHILVPGRCRGDLSKLSDQLGVSVSRGPDELKDLPGFFGKESQKPDLSRYDLKIFAEIVDAPHMTVESIVERAHQFRSDGADIIDIGCLPDTPFPNLEKIIQTLKQRGFTVSIDSLEADDLRRGGTAGADYMLSLHEDTLWIADQLKTIPVLIPKKPDDLSSLHRAINFMVSKNKKFMVDPILEPIHFGFTESLLRYREVRDRYPKIEILMGVGNLTELTHADTSGINAVLLGICSELHITNILATEVSSHACRAVREADLARRIMFSARQTNSLPKHVDDGLMALHERKPFPYDFGEIKELAEQIRDPSFRIQNSRNGVHVFNRDGLNTSIDPFDFYPYLNVDNDGGHAFYLGVQLARAQIAWQLGKRFVQDQPLNWGCAVEVETQDLNQTKKAGTTLAKKKPENDT